MATWCGWTRKGTLDVLEPDFDSRAPLTIDLSANDHGIGRELFKAPSAPPWAIPPKGRAPSSDSFILAKISRLNEASRAEGQRP